jgi:hypothetical protein
MSRDARGGDNFFGRGACCVENSGTGFWKRIGGPSLLYNCISSCHIQYFGGMVRGMRVARMAGVLGKTCIPHISSTGLGCLYMMHFVSAIPNSGPYHEFKEFNNDLPYSCPTTARGMHFQGRRVRCAGSHYRGGTGDGFCRSWKWWPRSFRNDDFATPKQTSIKRKCAWAKQGDRDGYHKQIKGSDRFFMRVVAGCQEP